MAKNKLVDLKLYGYKVIVSQLLFADIGKGKISDLVKRFVASKPKLESHQFFEIPECDFEITLCYFKAHEGPIVYCEYTKTMIEMGIIKNDWLQEQVGDHTVLSTIKMFAQIGRKRIGELCTKFMATNPTLHEFATKIATETEMMTIKGMNLVFIYAKNPVGKPIIICDEKSHLIEAGVFKGVFAFDGQHKHRSSKSENQNNS